MSCPTVIYETPDPNGPRCVDCGRVGYDECEECGDTLCFICRLAAPKCDDCIDKMNKVFEYLADENDNQEISEYLDREG